MARPESDPLRQVRFLIRNIFNSKLTTRAKRSQCVSKVLEASNCVRLKTSVRLLRNYLSFHEYMNILTACGTVDIRRIETSTYRNQCSEMRTRGTGANTS